LYYRFSTAYSPFHSGKLVNFIFPAPASLIYLQSLLYRILKLKVEGDKGSQFLAYPEASAYPPKCQLRVFSSVRVTTIQQN
jgi:hypothetical protein